MLILKWGLCSSQFMNLTFPINALQAQLTHWIAQYRSVLIFVKRNDIVKATYNLKYDYQCTPAAN